MSLNTRSVARRSWLTLSRLRGLKPALHGQFPDTTPFCANPFLPPLTRQDRLFRFRQNIPRNFCRRPRAIAAAEFRHRSTQITILCVAGHKNALGHDASIPGQFGIPQWQATGRSSSKGLLPGNGQEYDALGATKTLPGTAGLGNIIHHAPKQKDRPKAVSVLSGLD
jgi:hypothetical protein